MPELPEVETIKNQLSPFLPFKIDEVHFSSLTKRMVKQRDFDLKNHTIKKIRRHGKWLIFDLAPHGHILSHLGMSGSWRTSHEQLHDKHGHIEFIDHSKATNKVLTYVDPRRFGHFYILSDENFKKKEDTLGIDVSSPEFDEDQIAEIFFRFPNKTLKPFLLDQKAFPGVGNYMASEICARAGILPTRLTGDITAPEIHKIKSAIHVVVTGAVNGSGTTFSGGYRDANGDKGLGVQHLVVFHQKLCQMCRKTAVVKTVLGGRGTYHCPHCQI
ncbi:MAG: DNA-formamidopyrimidine glycosylase family protein [Bacteriovorax sp.]|jgi:formamidopyrimidine-DNA glycosylase